MVSSTGGGGAKSRKSISLRHTSARLLVLGDKRVGKSAAIVRYTTGRYIETYCSSTSDWLYKYPLPFDPVRNLYRTVELLEQRDVKFNNNNNSGTINSGNAKSALQVAPSDTRPPCSLSSRMALDQRQDQELRDRQQLVGKLNWANAYVIIYAINDVDSFNKAIKYLNLIANEVNNVEKNNNNNNNNTVAGGGGNNQQNSTSSKFRQKLSTTTSFMGQQQQQQQQAPPTSANAQSGSTTKCLIRSGGASLATVAQTRSDSAHLATTSSRRRRRPIILLANKTDLDVSGGETVRQVAQKDGRLLAMRHQSLFAEISVAQASKSSIEYLLTSLIEQISPCELHTSPINMPAGNNQLQQHADLTQAQLTYWIPPTGLACELARPSALFGHSSSTCIAAPCATTVGQQPIWSSLVRTRTPLMASSSSIAPTAKRIVQRASCLASIKARQPLNWADFRLITPIGASLSSGSSCSTSSTDSSSTMVPTMPPPPPPPLTTTCTAAQQQRQPASCKPLYARAEIQTVAGLEPLVASSVATMAPARLLASRPSVSSSSSSSSAATATTNTTQSSAKSQLVNRYKSFKSSFRKASLAIVGSRSLAARVKRGASGTGSGSDHGGSASEQLGGSESGPECGPTGSTESQRGSLGSMKIASEHETLSLASGGRTRSDSGNLSLVGSTAATCGQVQQLQHLEETIKSPQPQQQQTVASRSSFWVMRNKFDLVGGKQQQQQHDSCSISSVGAPCETKSGPLAAFAQKPPNGEQRDSSTTSTLSRFRRPLFKYISQRKTVAFEPMFKQTTAMTTPTMTSQEQLSLRRVQLLASSSCSSYSSNSSSSGGERTLNDEESDTLGPAPSGAPMDPGAN